MPSYSVVAIYLQKEKNQHQYDEAVKFYMWIKQLPGVKNLPAMQETWAQSLGQEDILEEEMATYSSILAWRIPWTEKLGGLQSIESQRLRND